MAKTVAVIGASRDRSKFGNMAVRAFLKRGYRVFPINPRATEIEGLPAYASLRDVPEPVEMVTIYVPPSVGERVLDDVAAREVAEVWVNPGAESPAVLARAASLGLSLVRACSIMGIGERPSDF